VGCATEDFAMVVGMMIWVGTAWIRVAMRLRDDNYYSNF